MKKILYATGNQYKIQAMKERLKGQEIEIVHRINGKDLTMEETQEYYAKALKEIGGESEAYYYTGLAIIKDEKIYTKEIKEDTFIFTSNICDKPAKYDALSRIQYDPKLKKYICELTGEELKNRNSIFDVECVNFIKSIV